MNQQNAGKIQISKTKQHPWLKRKEHTIECFQTNDHGHTIMEKKGK